MTERLGSLTIKINLKMKAEFNLTNAKLFDCLKCKKHNQRKKQQKTILK